MSNNTSGRKIWDYNDGFVEYYQDKIFSYVIIENDDDFDTYAIVTGFLNTWYVETHGYVSIPDIITPDEDKPEIQVKAIASGAFASKSELISIEDMGGVLGIGDKAFYNCRKLHDVMVNSVQEFGNEVFSGCRSLVEVDMPNATYVGENAFDRCSSLEWVGAYSIREFGAKAFAGCPSLTSISLLKQDEYKVKFGDQLFYNCSLFERITQVVSTKPLVFDEDFNEEVFGETVTWENTVNIRGVTLGDKVFYGCSKIVNISAKGVTGLGDQTLAGCSSLQNIDIPNVTNVYDKIFYKCSNLTNVNAPNVTQFGDYAFYNCSSLTNVDISGATSLGSYAFYNCSSLQSIDVSSASYIGNYAFYGCSSLQNILLYSLLDYIGAYTFYGTNLTSITIPWDVMGIGKSAFEGCNNLSTVIFQNNNYCATIDDNAFKNCKKLSSINLEQSMALSTIGEQAFYNCSSLTSIAFAENLSNLTTIGNYAFYNCSSLTNITIPNDIESIGNFAFCGCTNFTNIIIPDNIETIGNHAFSGCSAVTNVYLGQGLTRLGNYAFASLPILQTINYDIRRGLTYGEGIFNGAGVKLGSSEDTTEGSGTTLIIHDGVETILSIFSSPDGNSPRIKWLIMESDSVKKISSYAFYNTWIRNIYISGYVEQIGEHAFGWMSENHDGMELVIDCANLDKPDGWDTNWYALADENNNTLHITVNWAQLYPVEFEGIEYIQAYAGTNQFSANSLTNKFRCPDDLEIPNTIINRGVTCDIVQIAPSLFAGQQFSTVKLPDKLSIIGNEAFNGCVNMEAINLPDGLSTIGGEAFKGCTNINTINLPDGLSTIGGEAFKGCTNITKIDFYTGNASPAKATIGKNAFEGCIKIGTVNLLDSLSAIGEEAFKGCANITKIEFCASQARSPGVTIGKNAFEGCAQIKTVKVASTYYWCRSVFEPDNSKEIKYLSNPLCVRYKTDADIDSFVKLEFLGGPHILTFNNENIGPLVTIQPYAFYGQWELLSIKIPDYNISISPNAFYKCYKLVEIISKSTISKETLEQCGTNTIKYTSTKNPRVFVDNSSATYCYQDSSSKWHLAKSNNTKDLRFYSANGWYIQYIHQYAFYNSNIKHVYGFEHIQCSEEYSFEKVKIESVNTEDLDGWLKIEFKNAEANPLHNGASFYIGDESPPLQLTITQNIKPYAFYGCNNFKGIVLDCQSIGTQAFYKVNAKYCIILSKENQAFEDAFHNTTKDRGFKIYFQAKNLTYSWCIEDYDIVDYTNQTFDEKIGSWEYSFDGSSQEEKKATILTAGSCRDEYTIEETVYFGIHYKIVAIGEGAYKGTTIKKLTIDTNLLIGTEAFNGVQKLEELLITGEAEIGERAFADTTLQKITITNTSLIGNEAFARNDDLKELLITGQITINEKAFAETALQKITITSTTSIGKEAFINNNNLKELFITGQVTIGERAFIETSLQKAILTNAFSIGSEAFARNNTLSLVQFDSPNIKIQQDSFSGCGGSTPVLFTYGYNISNLYRNLENTVIYQNFPYGAINYHKMFYGGIMDYMGFTFDGKHSYYDLGVYRITNNNRYTENLAPNLNDKTVDVPNGDGLYYFGTMHKNQTFNIDFAFDGLTYQQLQEWKSFCSSKKISDLFFDETPYKVYCAKPNGNIAIKYIPFSARDQQGNEITLYKGEGTVEFVATWPYAHTPTENTKVSTAFCTTGTFVFDGKNFENYLHPNREEWREASGLTKITDGYDCENPGQLPAPFVLYHSKFISNNSVVRVGNYSITIKQDCDNLYWNSKNGEVYQIKNGIKQPVLFSGDPCVAIPIGGIKSALLNGGTLNYNYWYY